MRQRSTAATLRWDFTILVGFLVLVGLLRFAASGVVAAGLAARTQAVSETWQANAEVLQSLTDAETGTRGYQLTGDPAFLEPYQSGVATYPASMATALDLAPNAEIHRLLLDEQAAARAWLSGYGQPGAAAPPGQGGLPDPAEQG